MPVFRNDSLAHSLDALRYGRLPVRHP